jgi:hypothetical protein
MGWFDWLDPNKTFQNMLGSLGVFILGLVLIIIGILVMVNVIKIPKLLWKWVIAIALLGFGAVLMLGLI